jgi:biofilm PGA synthesis N-glycosyltransferase PgaC
MGDGRSRLKARHLALVPAVSARRDAADPENARTWSIRGREVRLSARARFAVSTLAGLSWAVLVAWFSRGWIAALGVEITLPLAVLVIGATAIVPAYTGSHLLASLLLDRPRPLRFLHRYPPLTLVVPVRNDEETIEETLTYALRSDYPGELTVLVADAGSTDTTCAIVQRVAAGDGRVTLVRVRFAGEARAMNIALARVSSPIVATIGPGTILMPYSLRRAVARLVSARPGTVAVAGAVLVRNSRDSLLAKIQEWDHFLGVTSTKRQQALLQGAVIAERTFSVYDRQALERAGGWPDRIRSDVVLSLGLLRNGGRTTFEPSAVAFTSVPTRLAPFVRERQRWTSGLIEGLREHGGALLQERRLRRHTIAVGFLTPYVDGVYTCAMAAGILLAARGDLSILGPLLIAVLPVSAGLAALMLSRQRASFRKLGLRIRWNPAGFALYLLGYQLLIGSISSAGCVRAAFRARLRR